MSNYKSHQNSRFIGVSKWQCTGLVKAVPHPQRLNMASTNISWNKIWKPLNSLEDGPQKIGVPESILRSGLVLPSEAELLEQHFRQIETILDRFSLYNLWLKVIDGDWSMLLVNGFIPRRKNIYIYNMSLEWWSQVNGAWIYMCIWLPPTPTTYLHHFVGMYG